MSTIGPNFIRLREEGKLRIVQERIEKDRFYFVLGEIEDVGEVNHAAVKKKIEDGVGMLLLHCCALKNPEKLSNNEKYQETGQYRAKNSGWTYVRKPTNHLGQPLANACCFENIDTEKASGCEWDIIWERRCIICRNKIPAKNPNEPLTRNICPKCINVELNKPSMIIHT